MNPPPEKPFPACLEERRLLIPGRRSMLGRKLLNWFNSQGLKVEILGEFDDAALMKAFGAAHNAILSRRRSTRMISIRMTRLRRLAGWIT
jgi:LysR family transcriptional activator of nhaA